MQYDYEEGDVDTSNLCCAYLEGKAYMDRTGLGYLTQKGFEDWMWDVLCRFLTASEDRPILHTTTDKEKEWIDLLRACPYVEQIDEAESAQGRYRVQLWVFRKHKEERV